MTAIWLAFFLTTSGNEVVIDLAGTEDNAGHLLVIQLVDFTDDFLEATLGQIVERSDGILVTQQRLRREDDQRLALIAQQPRRRSRWKICDGVVGWHTSMFISAQSCM